MCGILAVTGVDIEDRPELRRRVLALSRRLRHRGPDWSGIEQQPRAYLAHERLGIVDPGSGKQPLLDDTGDLALVVNGEIYNHRALRSRYPDYPFRTGSDCEVILPLWKELGPACVHELDGMFAFVISNAKTGEVYAARDHMGIVPLYYGVGRDGSTWFASEMKALVDDCERFASFPPGHAWLDGTLSAWFQPAWHSETNVPTAPLDPAALKEALEQAVVKRMMSDVPWGVLLSGGLDSSLVSAIAARHAGRRVEDDEQSEAWWPRLHSFSIGLEGAPDLAAARKVAGSLGTVHYEYTFTVQEGLDAIPDVIYHLETFDVTTIRASTPMYLMARKIRALGVKMVLSGEGADEIFGGYLYFHKAPNAEEFHHENVRKLKTLHLYDCLRANKSMCAWGVETRVPFLDKHFLATALSFDPTAKMSGTHPDGPRIEKHCLRAAFDTKDDPYLADEILWRQKEQFSDGVGYNWIDSIKEHVEAEVSDTMMAQASFRFPENTPATKEAYYFRSIFEEHYPQPSSRATVPGGPSIACSTPAAIAWDEAFKNMVDPSGRAVGVHNSAYESNPATTDSVG